MTLRVPDFPRDPNVRDLTLALNYRCNSKCRFCFIEKEIAEGHPDTPRDVIEEVFRKNRESGAFERIIFSGAEATLRKDLPEIVEGARARGGFSHVRIQTNGRRLRDRAYTERLVGAGLDEFFVSVHAPRSALDAHVTGAPHGFAEMQAGLRNVLACGARLISNTAVTRDNHRELPALARFLCAENVPEAEVWAFVEFGDVGQSHQHVRMGEALPFVREAAAHLRAAGVQVRLSWFPECMLGEHADLVHNHRAFTLILDEFSRRMHANAGFDCPHAARCSRFARTCIGLHERYRATFGDERDALVPVWDGQGAPARGGIGQHGPA
jgi:molybdenum cofactor biosynthesis enzyme MoaA